ncbi:MAG: hypothetical protein K6B41_15430 [Butyrivibrio sp.]|nr:hypothetical protein [Butyrivibrio sp.]
MFTIQEKKLLSLRYFKVITKSDSMYEIKSRNGDYWMIIKVATYVSRGEVEQIRQSGMDRDCYYILNHRHGDEREYHHHTDVGSVYNAILEIVSHDSYRFKGNNNLTEAMFYALAQVNL